jgi:GNAT superfamily N-acetyltransferase
MLVRPALSTDAADIARIHCAAWHETYAGLLPAAEIAAASDYDRRCRQWQGSLGRTDLRIAIAEGMGFACMGPQRDQGLRDMGYREELLAIYLLRQAQGRGLGHRLLQTVLPVPPVAYSIRVLAGNQPAKDFYHRIGATLLMERPEQVGATPIVEQIFGWSPPA